MLSASGERRHVAVRQASLNADETETLFIIRDTSAQHRFEEERQKARRLQALAESSALLAHEVRNPLASMELFASLLADATAAVPGNEDVRSWARHIQAGPRMIAATVNNVLHLRNPGPLQLREVDLVELLGTTTRLLEPVAHQCGVGIQFAPAVPVLRVGADPSRLQQVFFNLAVNAFRAMQPGGQLTISACCPDGESAQIAFRDQGCGIVPEDLSRIFEPGFSRVAGGSGFGLAVCRKIMEQHGAEIEVTSRVGEGTTVILTFCDMGDAA